MGLRAGGVGAAAGSTGSAGAGAARAACGTGLAGGRESSPSGPKALTSAVLASWPKGLK